MQADGIAPSGVGGASCALILSCAIKPSWTKNSCNGIVWDYIGWSNAQ